LLYGVRCDTDFDEISTITNGCSLYLKSEACIDIVGEISAFALNFYLINPLKPKLA
jgi:hypothetical protein